MIYKRLHRKQRWSNTNATKNRRELMCSGGTVSSCYSTCDTHRFTVITNTVVSQKRGKDQIIQLRQTEHIELPL